MFVRVDSGAVAVAPDNANGVIAYRLHVHHLERRFVQLKGRGRRFGGRGCAVRTRAGSARAVVPQITENVAARMPVFPVDSDALGLGNGDVLGVGGNHGQLSRRSTSLIPEMRRMAATSLSSCFLSRTSTVISIRAPSAASTSVRASRVR